MTFSVIIPVYNGKETIARTLDSICKQSVKDDIEVVIVNDCSTDDSLSIVNQYKEKLNLLICKTEQDSYHCPGNSRQLGIENATGDWITFIDQDDVYYEDAFEIVKNNLDNDYLVCFKLLLHEEDELRIPPAMQLDSWLHGKFYNRNNFIFKYNIHFKKDLMWAEDIYFNKKVTKYAYLLGLNNPFQLKYKDVYICEWIKNEKSLSNTPSTVLNKYYHNQYAISTSMIDILIYYISDIKTHLKTEQDESLWYSWLINYFVQIYTYWICASMIDEELFSKCEETIQKNLDVIKSLLSSNISNDFFKKGNVMLESAKEMIGKSVTYPSFNMFINNVMTHEPL